MPFMMLLLSSFQVLLNHQVLPISITPRMGGAILLTWSPSVPRGFLALANIILACSERPFLTPMSLGKLKNMQ
ncbi:hypothetical protein B0H10DRAFT_2050187 [Mycena sp. CBHHK59/15]|nr:hypothetical protein B0H10DRAFT_2050187 [Mycena sp. CBHHK59/15]